MKKIQQEGFGSIEVILIIVIIGLIGFFGWRQIRHNNTQKQAPTTTNTQNTDTSTKKNGFIDGPGDLKTYTNYTAGFSVEVPQEVWSSNGSQCAKISNSYRPTAGIVPATVIDAGAIFYVTEEYTYQVTKNVPGTADYNGCEKTIATPTILQKYIQHTNDALSSIDVIPITVLTARNQDEIQTAVRKIFNHPKVTAILQNKTENEWQDIQAFCEDSNTDTDNCPTFNYGFKLRYYEKKHKVVYIALGQSAKFRKPSMDAYYDSQVVNSFKILN